MKLLTLDEFISKSKKIHGENRYDYSKVIYVNTKTEVIILCNECENEFNQTPHNHLHGSGGHTYKTGKKTKGCGCPKCAIFNRNKVLSETPQSQINLTKLQREILIGSLLGDGTLSAVTGNKNSRFSCSHKTADLEWLNYKYEMLSNLCASGIKHKIEDKIIGTYEKKKYFTSKFQTYRIKELTLIEKKFYINRIKIIPSDLYLTPLMCATWYLDDGSNNQKGKYIQIATNCFKQEEVEFLIKELQRLGFNDCRLDPTKYSSGIQYLIRIQRRSYFKFIEMVKRVIKPFPKGMIRKIDTSKCRSFEKARERTSYFNKINVPKIINDYNKQMSTTNIGKKYKIPVGRIYALLSGEIIRFKNIKQLLTCETKKDQI